MNEIRNEPPVENGENIDAYLSNEPTLEEDAIDVSEEGGIDERNKK